MGDINESLGLYEATFVLQKILSKVFLKEVSAILPLDDKLPAWRPFDSTHFSLSVVDLQIILRNGGSSASHQVGFSMAF